MKKSGAAKKREQESKKKVKVPKKGYGHDAGRPRVVTVPCHKREHYNYHPFIQLYIDIQRIGDAVIQGGI